MSRSLRAAVLALLMGAPSGALAGQGVPAPDDAFRDPAARTLILRARDARIRDIEGMASYEGLLREHIYVGLTAARFRRERGLFEQERVARLRWSADGERAIQWIGARRAVPIVGADTRRDQAIAQGEVRRAGNEVSADMRRQLPDELLGEVDLPGFAFDPSGDRLAFGDDWALHPLSDSADAHYRFSSGDTLTLRLPDGRSIVLEEVLVEPRRADFHLVAGSLWFDAESAALVRATYRPARTFNLLLDEPEDAEDVPGFLQPVEAEISYITVEYSLQEFRYWLPRRFALEGEARLGRMVRIPLTVEWTVGDYTVNQASSEIRLKGPLPPGWSRREQRIVDKGTGRVSYVTVIVPETAGLLASPRLSEGFGQRTSTAFTDAEISDLKGELETLLPTYRRFQPQVSWGIAQGNTRHNRVEGLSTGVSVAFPFTPVTSLGLKARIGTGDLRPYGAATLTRGRGDGQWTISGYHRLDVMGDWENPFALTNSLKSLFLGADWGQYYRTTGAEMAFARTGKRTRLTLSGFSERQRPVDVEADFFLLKPISDRTPQSMLQADSVGVAGGRMALRWFSSVDPHGLILSGQLLGEAVGGDARYQRAAATVAASHPLPAGLAGAVEIGAGALWGDDILQRNFFLGGSGTLRGFEGMSVSGTSFWRSRAELATGFAGARLMLFGDAAWAGPRADFAFNDPYASVGVGTSLLDGLIRFDVARGVRRGSRWRLHFYLDGII